MRHGVLAAVAGGVAVAPSSGASPVTAPLAVHSSQKFWTVDGRPWRYIGCSLFALEARYRRGEDIAGVLAAYKGFNVARVFTYTPEKDWGATAWDAPTVDEMNTFLRVMAMRGWRVNLCVLTDDDAARKQWGIGFVNALRDAQHPNLLLEAGNEPLTHKTIDVDALRPALEASGYPYTCGRFENEATYWGSFVNDHPRDDGADQIRGAGHGLMEWWTGAGPEQSHPPYHMPIIVGEQDRPDNANILGPDDFLAIAAGCALFGAGGTCHTQSGKFALPPAVFPPSVSGKPNEADYVAAYLRGMTAFPADACLGAYSHGPAEKADEQQTGSLRTYRVGPYGVRVRPTNGAPILIGV